MIYWGSEARQSNDSDEVHFMNKLVGVHLIEKQHGACVSCAAMCVLWEPA